MTNDSKTGKFKKGHKMHLTHGMRHHRAYNTWNHLRQRCDNPKDNRYARYGGRGISYDPRWKKFINFWNDMKDGYYDGAQIDRIDNDGDYTKDNCRWVSCRRNARNKENTIRTKINNQTKTLKDWCDEYDTDYQMVWQRIYRYQWSPLRALTTPSRQHGK